jgi:hypothetical protein
MDHQNRGATTAQSAAVWLDRALRFALAAVLAWAAFAKLANLDGFAKTVAEFGLVFDALVRPVATLLPVAELVSAILLVANLRGGRLAVLALSLLFVFVTGYGLWLGLDIDCGCFGPGDNPNGGDLKLAFGRSLAMAVASAYLYVRPRRAPFSDRSI